MKIIDDDIKNKTFKPVYLIYGEEGYLVNQYRKKLIQAIAGDNTFNLTVVNEKPDIKELKSLADTLPFMSEKRLIVLDRCSLFKMGKDALKIYERFVTDIPDHLCVVIVEESADKRFALYKAAAEKGHVCEIKTQSQANVTAFITNWFKSEGKSIDKNAAYEIYIRTVGDLGMITGELEKLLAYTSGRDVITIEDVKASCSVRVESHVFDMVDAIAHKDKRKTYRLYFDLLAVKESPMKILILLEKHFAQLFQVSKSPRMPAGELAKTIGMKGVPPFVAGKLLKQVVAFTPERLKEITELFAETEEDIKTGKMTDRTGTELMIAEALL